MGEVRTAIVNACTTEGWTWDASVDVLWKDTKFVKITTGANNSLALLGRTALTTGAAPTVVWIGDYSDAYSPASNTITFPLTYHIFVFAEEVFCTINYATFDYQMLAFGKSSQCDHIGTGLWVYAPLTSSVRAPYRSMRTPSNRYGRYGSAMGKFESVSSYDSTQIHNNIDPTFPWATGYGIDKAIAKGHFLILGQEKLLLASPNQFNNEGVLLPVRIFKRHASDFHSLILEVQNMRELRIDNYDPGEIIQLGSEYWMVLPWWRKNLVDRGGNSTSHSGTYGYAIRYEPV